MEENVEEIYEELERAGQGGTSASTIAKRSASVTWLNTFQRYESKTGNRELSETANLADLSDVSLQATTSEDAFSSFNYTSNRLRDLQRPRPMAVLSDLTRTFCEVKCRILL